jgi:protein TonB
VAGLQRDIGLARAQHAAVPAPETPPRAAPEASQPVQAEPPAEPAAPRASPPAGGPREVVEASLTRTRPLQIDYPMYALSKKIEGQVEVAYLVTPKGVVSDLKVLTATPPGLFDDAATTAISRLRYKPVIDAGKPVAVSTKMLVTFRLAK